VYSGWSRAFLSTPSVGRATVLHGIFGMVQGISIHALRGEGDGAGDHDPVDVAEFLSTPSVGRATDLMEMHFAKESISIHALRGEGDVKYDGFTANNAYFYPRPPWGGRRRSLSRPASSFVFLSTPSVGRATS